jgi:hypothetical protein
MLAKWMRSSGWPSSRTRRGATSTDCWRRRSDCTQSAKFASPSWESRRGRRLTSTIQRHGKAGTERQVSFPFVLCSDKASVSKGGSHGKEG